MVRGIDGPPPPPSLSHGRHRQTQTVVLLIQALWLSVALSRARAGAGTRLAAHAAKGGLQPNPFQADSMIQACSTRAVHACLPLGFLPGRTRETRRRRRSFRVTGRNLEVSESMLLHIRACLFALHLLLHPPPCISSLTSHHLDHD